MHPIQEIRKAGNLSQAALAKELNVTQSTISQYERGQIRPDVVHALRLLDIAQRLKLRIRMEDMYMPRLDATLAHPEPKEATQEPSHV